MVQSQLNTAEFICGIFFRLNKPVSVTKQLQSISKPSKKSAIKSLLGHCNAAVGFLLIY